MCSRAGEKRAMGLERATTFGPNKPYFDDFRPEDETLGLGVDGIVLLMFIDDPMGSLMT